MTVQRITFEDRGQDFLWWEIQMETGRVVGCGPLQAWLWADGRASVDVETIRVGACPRYFSPAHGPDGAVLRYAVVSVERAPTSGGGVASMTDLQTLIDAIEAKIATAGDITSVGHDAYFAAGRRIGLELEAELGARFKEGAEHTMALGGVRTTSTGGWFGLFRNWQNAARRCIAQKEAQS